MDTMRDLSSALWSLRTSQEAARRLRTSLSLLRCFLFFDICYLIGGITLIAMALCGNNQDNRMVFAGGLLTLFGSLAAMCNRLVAEGGAEPQQDPPAWRATDCAPGGAASSCPGSSSSSSSSPSSSSTSPRSAWSAVPTCHVV
jgi:hypothetical protein